MKSLTNLTSAAAEARIAMRVIKANDSPPVINSKISKSSRIAIQSKDGLRMIRVQDILYLKAESNYCTIHTQQGKHHLISKALNQLSQRLESFSFVRAHQSYLVNCSYIEMLCTRNAYELLLLDGSRIPVSRRRGSAVKDYLNNQFSI